VAGRDFLFPPGGATRFPSNSSTHQINRHTHTHCASCKKISPLWPQCRHDTSTQTRHRHTKCADIHAHPFLSLILEEDFNTFPLISLSETEPTDLFGNIGIV
jgi:hypothetical protein